MHRVLQRAETKGVGLDTVAQRVDERVRATNAGRAEYLSLAFAFTFFVAGVADYLSMGTLRNHGFMLGQLVTCLAVAAVVHWTPTGRRHAGPLVALGIVAVSAFGAAHLAQFGGFDGPWFYGSYAAPPILIAILLSRGMRAFFSVGMTAAFTLIYWYRQPEMFAHPMAHVPVIYLIVSTGISVGMGQYVFRLEVASFTDAARLDVASALLEARLREGEAAPSHLRLEIARQLHDDVAQLITGARIHLDGWSPNMKDKSHTRLGDLLDELGRRAHRMLDELRDPPAQGPLIEELERLRVEYSGLGLTVDLLIDEMVLTVRPSPEQVSALVASTREALTNAVRHGRATEATVSVYAEPLIIELKVMDNGGGRVANAREGYGLLGIRERVEALGGTAQLSDYDEGMRLSIILPRAEAL